MFKVEMLCTDNEVLHGQIVNTNIAWLAKIAAYFAERDRDMMALSNCKQVLTPASASLIDNLVGTAYGFALQLNRCLLFLTRHALRIQSYGGARNRAAAARAVRFPGLTALLTHDHT